MFKVPMKGFSLFAPQIDIWALLMHDRAQSVKQCVKWLPLWKMFSVRNMGAIKT